MNHASKKLAENLIASTEINNECEIIVDKIIDSTEAMVNHLFDVMQKMDKSQQVQDDTDLIRNLNGTYNVINIFGGSLVIEALIDEMQKVVVQMKRLKNLNKTSEEKLIILMRIVSNIIHHVKAYNEIIGLIKQRIDKEYLHHQSQFFETRESLFGSMDTFNVQFVYKDNWLLTELYNQIMDKIERGIATEQVEDIVRIFLSNEYQSISQHQYMTDTQSVNYQNTYNVLLPFVHIIQKLQEYERSDT